MNTFVYRLRFYSRREWRERIVRWIAWHLPRDVAYWAFIRVQTANCEGNPAERPVIDTMKSWEEKGANSMTSDEPLDVLDGARLEYRECLEVRRLLGYLWMATGKNYLRAVHTLFDENDPIIADIERLAIFPETSDE